MGPGRDGKRSFYEKFGWFATVSRALKTGGEGGICIVHCAAKAQLIILARRQPLASKSQLRFES